jgi:hypothetical protein
MPLADKPIIAAINPLIEAARFHHFHRRLDYVGLQNPLLEYGEIGSHEYPTVESGNRTGERQWLD